MRVVIAGGHGQVGLRLERLLTARGDVVAGLVRNPDHIADVEATGSAAYLCDLETATVDEVAGHLGDVEAEAVVFAAGAGPGSGVARKDTVDRGAAVLLADAAEKARVRRYLMVSAIRADEVLPSRVDPAFGAYLRAKAAADQDLRERDLDWTILRPGSLTNHPGTGLVRLGSSVGYGEVPRDDVAAVLVALLDEPRTAHKTLELVSGGRPITAAIRAVVGS
ncbi:MAG TPA: SDR family oxidoreductase [Nocardioidaceae bacterium]|nr:SDR family oxidoreductase [Nocardioidaceae bacterium]